MRERNRVSQPSKEYGSAHMKEAHYGNEAQCQNKSALMATSKTDFQLRLDPTRESMKQQFQTVRSYKRKACVRNTSTINCRFTGMPLISLIRLYLPINTRWHLDERMKGDKTIIIIIIFFIFFWGGEVLVYNTKSSILPCKILRRRILRSHKLHVCFNVSIGILIL